MGDPAPEWLSEPAPAPAPAPTHDSLAQPTSPTAAATRSTEDGVAEPADLPSVILTMRLANMGVSAAMIVISVVGLISFEGASTFVLSIYAIIGSTLICCLETQLKFLRVMIAVNFGFLFSSIWRFLFYLLLASIAFSYNALGGRIVGSGFVFVAFYNTYVLCRYPSYRKVREKIAEEEDKRIEARISKEVKKQMAGQIMK